MHWSRPRLELAGVTPRVEDGFHPESNRLLMPAPSWGADRGGMTITDYLINAVFVLVVTWSRSRSATSRPSPR